MHNIRIQQARLKLDELYEFNKWKKEMPALHFNPEWDVKIIPPFNNAIVRFTIDYNNKHISCYLDCYDELGLYGEPYWELYPIEEEVFRCGMQDVKALMTTIEQELNKK